MSPDEKIDIVIRQMASESKKVFNAGLAVVLDSNNRVLGVVTDGDVRRAYANGINWILYRAL